MTATPALVAFPVLYATVKLHIDKGRRWNALEHLLLHAVCEKYGTASELAQISHLPRRLVIEIMIRLMRVGWVEIVGVGDATGFHATVAGRKVVRYESLPAVTRPISRRGSFAIDRICGAVFRARDLTLYSQTVLDKIRKSSAVIVMEPQISNPHPQVDEVISTLLEDDERCQNLEPMAGKPGERFAVVRVDGESVGELPARAPRSLVHRILQAAKDSVVNATDAKATPTTPYTQEEPRQVLDVVFSPQDLVLGGDAHRKTFELILRKAKHRIVIHSTFINSERFGLLLPLFKDAARRGVRVDVLWGKSKNPDGSNPTAIEVETCRRLLVDDYVVDKVRLHGFSTNSHSKLVLADNGRGQFVGLVGSCNWLSTGFEGFDVSAFFTDPVMVGEVASKLSSMTVGGSGQWTELARELGALSATLRKASRPAGPKAKVCLVMGGEHDRFVRQARDEATRRIVVASHRFSDTAETAVLVPARAAMEKNGIEVTLMYGRTSGAKGGKLAMVLAEIAQQKGIRLKQVYRPRFHAKFLAWDDDSIVVSSQNWLSADPPESHPFAEIGVYISTKGIAKELVDLSELATNA